jgi:hypothetical protein
MTCALADKSIKKATHQPGSLPQVLCHADDIVGFAP